MKPTLYTLLATTALLASCASLGGKEGLVQAIGKDSFTVRVLSQKSVSDAKQRALSQANAYCGQNKRNVQLVKEESGTEETGERFYDATFYCLPLGDADYTRFRPTAVPATPNQ